MHDRDGRNGVLLGFSGQCFRFGSAIQKRDDTSHQQHDYHDGHQKLRAAGGNGRYVGRPLDFRMMGLSRLRGMGLVRLVSYGRRRDWHVRSLPRISSFAALKSFFKSSVLRSFVLKYWFLNPIVILFGLPARFSASVNDGKNAGYKE